jgi:hypothetical protein
MKFFKLILWIKTAFKKREKVKPFLNFTKK